MVANERLCRSQGRVIFVALFAAYLLLILGPILLADRYCNDDLIRVLHGNYGWNNNGRLLTNFVMRVLQLGSSRLIDIFPLPQLIAIAVLAWIGVLIAQRYRIHSPLAAVVFAFPLGAQPFFLENLSYRFDAPCMALALLLAALPLLSIAPAGRKKWWLGVLALLASLNLYQPAINVFLVFAILEFALNQQENAVPMALSRQLFGRALQALLACGVYRLFFGTSIKGWIKEHGQTIHGPGQWRELHVNVADFYQLLASAFSSRWLLLFVPLALLIVVVPTIASVRYAVAGRFMRSRWHTLLLFVASLLLPCAWLLCLAGPMLLLARPVLMPRVMLGVGALLCAALIATHAVLRYRPTIQGWLIGIACIWALGFAICAAAYGNAAAAQKRYEDRIATRLADDLAELRSRRQVRNYVINGSAAMAPATAHAAAQFPLLRKLVLPYLRDNDFNTRNFLMFYLPHTPDLLAGADASAADVASTLLHACAAPSLTVRSDYNLKLVGDTAVVNFLREPGHVCDAASVSGSPPVTHVQPPQQIH
ncbi:MAG: glucosyltransferase domain-containing protein [Rudaea sp.]